MTYFSEDMYVYFLREFKLKRVSIKKVYEIYKTIKPATIRNFHGRKDIIARNINLYNLLPIFYSGVPVFDESKLKFYFSYMSTVEFLGEQEIIRVSLYDGRTLECSPSQKVLTDGMEWVHVNKLQPSTAIVTDPVVIDYPQKVIRGDTTIDVKKYPVFPSLEPQYGEIKRIDSFKKPVYRIKMLGDFDNILINKILVTTDSTYPNTRNAWESINVQ